MPSVIEGIFILNTAPCKLLGIKYPIIQAGMVPFSNNKLCIDTTFEGDESRALYAGGECAQRINDMPTVQAMVDGIVSEA